MKCIMFLGIVAAALLTGCEVPLTGGADNSETITAGGDVIIIQNSDGTTEVVNKPKEEMITEAE